MTIFKLHIQSVFDDSAVPILSPLLEWSVGLTVMKAGPTVGDMDNAEAGWTVSDGLNETEGFT